MWLAITMGIVLLGSALALYYAFKKGHSYGIAEEANEQYEAANNTRELARRIRDRAKRLYSENHKG